MFCKQCGNQLKENDRFCPNCGAAAELVEEMGVPGNYGNGMGNLPDVKSSRRSPVLWLLSGMGIMLVVVLAVVGVISLVRDNGKDGSKETGVAVEDKENPGDVPNAARGYDTEDELIEDFIKCLSGELDFEEFYKSFDMFGCFAYALKEYDKQGQISTFEDAYAIVTNPQYGADYFNQYFSECMEPLWGRQMTDEDFALFREGEGEWQDVLKRSFSKNITRFSEEYGLLEKHVSDENKYTENDGIRCYAMEVDDPTIDANDIKKVQIRYVLRNGKYYWIFVNDLHGTRGG